MTAQDAKDSLEGSFNFNFTQSNLGVSVTSQVPTSHPRHGWWEVVFQCLQCHVNSFHLQAGDGSYQVTTVWLTLFKPNMLVPRMSQKGNSGIQAGKLILNLKLVSGAYFILHCDPTWTASGMNGEFAGIDLLIVVRCSEKHLCLQTLCLKHAFHRRIRTSFSKSFVQSGLQFLIIFQPSSRLTECHKLCSSTVPCVCHLVVLLMFGSSNLYLIILAIVFFGSIRSRLADCAERHLFPLSVYWLTVTDLPCFSRRAVSVVAWRQHLINP